MLIFRGEEEIAAKRDRVWLSITNTETLGKLIPNLEKILAIDERGLKCKIRPGFSFVRGTMDLQIRLENLQASDSAKMIIDATGVGTRIEVHSTIQLQDRGESTLLVWTAEVIPHGLLSHVSEGLLRGAANQLIRELFERARKTLENH